MTITQGTPPLSDEVAGPLTIDCPQCRVKANQPCRDRWSRDIKGKFHQGRIDNYDAPIAPIADPFGPCLEGTPRWQYAVVNIGMFKSAERMAAMLASAGSQGWEIAATMDKQSNWLAGMEKGFLLMKRPVPEGYTPEQWCITVKG